MLQTNLMVREALHDEASSQVQRVVRRMDILMSDESIGQLHKSAKGEDLASAIAGPYDVASRGPVADPNFIL